jgi:hypothetical protein
MISQIAILDYTYVYLNNTINPMYSTTNQALSMVLLMYKIDVINYKS